MQHRTIALLSLLAQALWAVFEKVRGIHAEYRNSIPVLTRFTAHLGIVALVIGGLLLSGLEIRAEATPVTSDRAGEEPPPIYSEGEPTWEGGIRIVNNPFTNRSIIEIGPSKAARHQVVQYTVQANDTVTRIAAVFHITPESVLWANAKLEDNPDLLAIGQTLNIPPTNGVLYTVRKGDTIEGVAAKFKAKAEHIFNDPLNQGLHNLKANPPQLAEGEFLMVPGGEKPLAAPKVNFAAAPSKGAARGTNSFVWPLFTCVTQYFRGGHSGIDLGAPKGTPVVAADSGFVEVLSRSNVGYGNMILLNHGNGYLSRYAHLSAFNVASGQSVKKGALIGRVGSTGHSTGPHLHFELIWNGGFKNPVGSILGRVPGRCAGY